MRILVAALGLLLAALPAAADAPLKRLTLRQDLLGWEAIGRVEIGGRGYCTGVLIAADLVLTAAHCLLAGGESLAAPGSLRFRAGLRDGVALAESQARRAVVHPSYAPGGDAADRIRHDVGLIELATPVPVSAASPFQAVALADGARDLTVVSYGQGRDEALSRDESCSVLGRAEGLIAFDCDVTFGSSGAPVFRRTGGRAELVSLVSGGVTETGERLAFGMERPRAVADLKAALRRGEGAAAEVPAAGAAARILRPAPGLKRQAAGGAKFVRP